MIVKKAILRTVTHPLIWALLLDCLAWPAKSFAQDSGTRMILVEGGTFLMGDISGYGYDNEKPVRQVTVNSFNIGKIEVTFDEYDAYCQETGQSKPWIPYGWERGQRPVANLSWAEAVEYCNWRSRKEGLTPAYERQGSNIVCDFAASGYRLPTEAEWEYAARGGRNSDGYQYSGSDNPDEVAWYSYNAEGTHPVGQKRANELGIYDMSGNVWEWCWDWYGSYEGEVKNNPTGPLVGEYHVQRGGGVASDARNIRVSERDYFHPAYRSHIYHGFRLARSQV